MSEAEKRRRLHYRKVRKRWIGIQAIVLAAILLAGLICTAVYYKLDETHYIDYTEESKVDYGVYLKPNDFYKETYLGKEMAYLGALIDKIDAEFAYGMSMHTSGEVDFSYTYRIDAVLEIMEKTSQTPVFSPVYPVVSEQTGTRKGTSLEIREIVSLDYDQFNDLANDFIEAYSLKNMKCNLVLKMYVSVVGSSDEFQQDASNNEYVVLLHIPLTTDVVEGTITTNTLTAESKVLAVGTGTGAAVFRVMALILMIGGALFGVELICFIYLTRNTDITYELRVSRLVRAYKSFIQKITNEFDTAGYQVLFLDSFQAMLEIRDTIQSPILMHENDDRTCTRFLIPTNTKILYVFELKVDDYDELYGTEATTVEEPVTPPAPVEEVIERPVIKIVDKPVVVTVERPVVEFVEKAVVIEAEKPVVVIPEPTPEPIPEPTPEPEPIVEEVEEPIVEAVEESVPVMAEAEEAEGDEDDDDDGKKYSRVRRSFMAKLIQSTVERKEYYSEIKNELLSYRNVKSRISWTTESFNRGRTHLVKLAVRGKTLCMCVALAPEQFAESKYFYTDVSETAKYSNVPMMVKIKSNRGVKHAKELIAMLAETYELEKLTEFEPLDYVMPYQTTPALIAQGLIKDPNGEYANVQDPAGEDVELLEPISVDVLARALATPAEVLEEIDYIDTPVAEDAPNGVEVVDVVWNEKETGNELYRYDPNGATLETGDEVLIPTEEKETVRRAAVAHANHKVEPYEVDGPLKKIIGVLRRKMQDAINSGIK